MKKIFFSLLAIAAIASCAKTEAVYEGADSEIKLVPVTALQTKANVLAAIDGTEYPTAENFDVYGYWKNGDDSNYTDGASYFGGAVEFTNKGNYWGGVKTYYWPKNGTLRFAAYSPSSLDVDHNQEGDTFTKTGYVQPSNTAETYDFLVAPTSAPYTAMTAAEKVSVVFEHALSWITIKVVAKDAVAQEVFTIKNITINGVNTKADFEASMLGKEMVDYESWSNWGTPAEYVVFNGEQAVTGEATVIEDTAAGTLVIPQETTSLTVTFDQKGVNGTLDTPGMTQTLDLVLDTEDTPWEPGKHYNYTLVFCLDEILINPSVADWEEVVVNEIEADANNVYSLEQLEAALKLGGKIVLQEDIEATSLKVSQNTILDLNGHTIAGTDNLTSSYALLEVQPDMSLTVNGPGTLTAVATENRGWNAFSSVLSNQRGALVVNEGVVVEHLGGTDMAYGIDNLTNTGAQPAIAAVNGATVKSPYRAIRQFLNSATGLNKLTVRAGSKIEGGNKAIWVQDANANANPGKITVAEGAELKGDVYLTVTAGSTAWPVEVAIADAAFVDGYTVLTSESIEAVNNDGVWTAQMAYAVNGNTITVSTAEGLVNIADKVNAGDNYFEGKTIVLGADIDLNNVEWTPIGSATAEHGFMGNFDGNGKVIKNLTIKNAAVDADGYAYVGLFGVTEGAAGKENSIKNLVIENVNIETTGDIAAAAIAYPYYTTLENITVKGDIHIKGGNYTAGVLAYTRRCVNAKNIEIVADQYSTIEGKSTVGGVISDIQTNGGLKANYSNFKASGLSISGTQCVGGITGIISGQTLDGATVENVTLSCGDHRVGIVAGAKGTIGDVTNVTYSNVAGATEIIGAPYKN